MIKSDYIVFDVETGGLDETRNPITQYAAMVLDGCTLKVKDRFETFVKPYNNLTIEPIALKSTMVSMSDINSGVNIKEFVDAVTGWWDEWQASAKNRELGRLIAVGHNVPFDIRFVDCALKYAGAKGGFFHYHHPNFIDTFAIGKLAWGTDREAKLNLGMCCKRAGVKLTDAHGAMNDVEATADLLRWYVKKLRADKAVVVGAGEDGRKKGDEFFEFKCAK
jgi:DNA polymerase III alpha subunit (gram-positive type)